jgi:hypothetical protein
MKTLLAEYSMKNRITQYFAGNIRSKNSMNKKQQYDVMRTKNASLRNEIAVMCPKTISLKNIQGLVSEL